MKRLLQISLDTLLISVLPILMWIILGFILTKDIANVFSLTYPLQFFFMFFEALFSKGPNVTAQKENNPDIVYSNIILGSIFVGILGIILILNVDAYISFMHMEPHIYHNFAIYSIIWLYLSFVVGLILQKLYFDNKNDESNKINLIFNISNFVLILGLNLFLKDYLAIGITLSIDFIITIIILFKYLKIPNFVFAFKQNIKYSSFSLLRNICMLLSYGIGMGRSFSYGEKFIIATNFESLTTDTQWDILYSVDTVSKIDLAENKFDYRQSLKNAYRLLGILIFSILFMNVVLYWYYKPDLSILVVLLAIQFIDMLTDPLKTLRISYLQINESTKKHNIFFAITRLLRVLCSFIPSAFCTYISQFISMIILLIYSFVECKDIKEFKLAKSKA